MSAARHCHRLDENSELVPWLFSIARNRYRNARRFLFFDLRKRERVALEPEAESQRPDAVVQARIRLEQVWEAFDALPEKHREILMLSLVEQLETQQIATILNLNHAAVRKRLSRARAELARLVKARDAKGSPKEVQA